MSINTGVVCSEASAGRHSLGLSVTFTAQTSSNKHESEFDKGSKGRRIKDTESEEKMLRSHCEKCVRKCIKVMKWFKTFS